jgi:DNA repair protein RecO (recombination protein O)
MHWDDTAYLLSKNRYSENSIIAEFFTENHGKCSGIIFGASSRKIKNYLQIGNKLYVNHASKNEGRLGYFKVEILEALTPIYFDNKKKLLCLTSAMNLIKILTVEAQTNIDIYKLINSFFWILKNDNWIKNYIFWELELLKLVGYDLELKNIVNREIIDDEIKYFVKNSKEKKIVPNFLIDSNKEILDNRTLMNGLKLVGDFLDKNVLKPKSINYPAARFDFINILK